MNFRTLDYDIDSLGLEQSPLYFDEPAPSGDNSFLTGLGPSSIADGQLLSNIEQGAGTLFNGKRAFSSTSAGYRLGVDTDGELKFIIGDASSSMDWNVTTADTLTIVGAITATTGTIGGFTIGSDYIRDAADSFGLASTVSGSDDVRFWAGDTFANRASADFRVTEAGAVTASSITITGGSIAGTPISSIPNNSSTDISLLDYTHDLVFSVTDNNTVAWASGTITLSNGRTFSITGSNTGNMAARTYIYLDTAVSSTALQTTTTVSTAMGANKKLIAVAQNQTAEASFTVFNGIGGLKLPEAGTSISNNNWVFSGTWTLTDANTVAWGSGTLTISNGNSYSITGSNTGNMTAKTYIYFALGTSSTAFQTTTTRSTAVGAGKILIAIAEDGTDEPTLMVMNDDTFNIDASNIVAGSITANEIEAGSITATELNVSQLSAISANMGTITAGTIGAGTATIGGWTIGASTISASSGIVGLSSAVTGGDDIRFWAGDATPASAEFRVTESGALTATSATITGAITATSGSIGNWSIISNTLESGGGNIVLDADDEVIKVGTGNDGGAITLGTATAPLTGNGIYLGVDTGVGGGGTGRFDFRAGDPAGVYIHWDDSANTLNIEGGSLNVGTTGNVRGGSTDYLTGTGWFAGYSGGQHKLSFGNPSGRYVAWDGSTLTVNGYQLNSQGSFGGDGSDGALAITSGTTTISAASASTLIKNYTSISITSTAKLAFSNPHSGGTLITLKSQGGVTITSSGSPSIDTRGMGAAGGSAGNDGTSPNSLVLTTNTPNGKFDADPADASAGGSQYDMPNFYTSSAEILSRRYVALVSGAGGAGGETNGTSTGGAGGRGGGALLIECAGALNFNATGTINSSGNDASDATAAGGTDEGGGGGGGGSAGMVLILYNTLTSAAGTITAEGGDGGDGSAAAGTTGDHGNGGGGAGSLYAAGGAGAAASSTEDGSAAAGVGAGGGGGRGDNGVGGDEGVGGAGGATMGGLVAKNLYFG